MRRGEAGRSRRHHHHQLRQLRRTWLVGGVAGLDQPHPCAVALRAAGGRSPSGQSGTEQTGSQPPTLVNHQRLIVITRRPFGRAICG